MIRLAALLAILILTGCTLAQQGAFDVKSYERGHVAQSLTGTVGDGVTDDIEAIQDAYNALAASGGGDLRLGEGTFLISVPISMWAVSDGMLIGEGPGATKLLCSGSGGVILSGGQCHISGIRFGTVTNGTGIGISGDNIAYAEVSRCVIEGFEYGMGFTDILTSAFDGCILRGNSVGFTAARDNYSHPNALSFRDCYVSLNGAWGINLVSPSCLNITGGSVEGNGHSAAPYGGGVVLINPGAEGAVGITARGVYFEFNAGVADVYCTSAGSGGNVANSFTGCTFNRINETLYVTNNVKIEQESAGALSITGCGFKGFNGYAPSTGRKYIAVFGPVSTGASGNFMSSEDETP